MLDNLTARVYILSNNEEYFEIVSSVERTGSTVSTREGHKFTASRREGTTTGDLNLCASKYTRLSETSREEFFCGLLGIELL